MTVGWALALAFATQLGFRTSGGYLNPAFTLFQYTTGQLGAGNADNSLKRLAVYCGAQFLGAYLGAALTFLTYFDAIQAFDGGERYVTGPLRTAMIYSTYPSEHLGLMGAAVEQVLATAFFVLCVAMIRDRRHRLPSWSQPMLIGLSLLLVGVAFGFNSSFGVNPARDFGPRLFTLCAGYGWRVVSFRSYKWFWIPFLCPFLGACLGGWFYHALIGIHIPSELDELEEEVRRIQTDKANNSSSNGGNNHHGHYTNHYQARGSTGSILEKPPLRPVAQNIQNIHHYPIGPRTPSSSSLIRSPNA